ncbi:MAG: UDP-N-acetylmuramate dehydrogenase [Bacteroidota bacterium]
MISKKNVSLKAFNTLGFEAKAQSFYNIRERGDLLKALKTIRSDNQKFTVIGGGSNILLTRDVDGAVIKNSIPGKEILDETADFVKVKFGAGENWHECVLYALQHNWGGIENLSLIPGTMGAAPMQNIGAYGVEICNVFVELTALNVQTHQWETFSNSDCSFGYRESVFKNTKKGEYIIVDVTLKLTKENHNIDCSYGAISAVLKGEGIDKPSIQDVSNAVIQIRKSKLPDPKDIGNAGSFFKNPTIDKIDYEGLKAEFTNIPGYELPEDKVKVPAAWLIEQCGWKGITKNKVGVHKNQALVLVHYGGGTGHELWELALEIQKSVADKFGIDLRPEVNII